MKTGFDASIVTFNNDLLETRIKIQELIDKALEKKYDQNEDVFTPFLLATLLHAIYRNLLDAQSSVTRNYRDVIRHLEAMIALQNQLNNHLTEMHNPLITVIENGKISLVFMIIKQLLSVDDPDSEIWEDYNAIKALITLLISEKTHLDPTSIDVLQAADSLFKHLLERTFAQKITVIENCINEKFTVSPVLCFEELSRLLIPVNQEITQLFHDIQTNSFDSLMGRIKNLIFQINNYCDLCIKNNLETHCTKINNSPWAKLADKKISYMEIIQKMQLFLKIIPLVELTENERKMYCNHLFTGFELTKEAQFLQLILQFGNKYYADNTDIMQSILDYIHSAENNDVINDSNKKRVRFANADTTIDQRPAKQPALAEKDAPVRKKILPDSNNISHFENAVKFINFFNSVKSENNDLSRKFVAGILSFLPYSIHKINNIPGSFKILMMHKILMYAQNICPTHALDLSKDIQLKLDALCKDHFSKRLINDHKKFAHGPILITNDTPGKTANSVAIFTQHILTEFCEELESVMPHDNSFNELILQVANNWISSLEMAKNKPISTEVLARMKAPYVTIQLIINKEFLQETSKEITPECTLPTTSKMYALPMVKALRQLNTDQFKLYLENFKAHTSPEKFLNFLIEKSASNTTPLHAVLHSGIFINVYLYLSEVKQAMAHGNHSFSNFLLSQTSGGLTFLHLIAKSGDYGYLKFTAQCFKKELTANEYAIALRMQSSFGYQPSCPADIPDSDKINTWLQKQRDKYPSSNDRNNTRDRFFHHDPECMVIEKTYEELPGNNIQQ